MFKTQSNVIKVDSNKSSRIRSQKGFGLVEVMVAAGLLLIISLGVTSLITNMMKEQRRQTLLQNLLLIQSRFENIIKNNVSWGNTFSGTATVPNANMACLRLNFTCDGSNVAAPINMVDATANDIFVNSATRDILLKDASGVNSVFYDGRQASNTSGFTESGSVCTGFSYNMATGNDSCPIGYIVNWRALNSGTVPQLVVVAKLIFNPSDTNPFKNLINASATTLLGKYDVRVLRTATATSKAFLVNITRNLSAINCATGGFGQCNTAAFASIGNGDSRTTVAASDPYSLILADAIPGSGLITFKETGSYKCTARSSAFATDGAQLQIRQTTPTSSVVGGPIGSFASSNRYGYTTLLLETTINIVTANATIQLEQKCDTVPVSGSDAGIASCALGFSAAPYSAGSIVATLSCVKVE